MAARLISTENATRAADLDMVSMLLVELFGLIEEGLPIRVSMETRAAMQILDVAEIPRLEDLGKLY